MELDFFIRLILGGLLPGIIGLEREYRAKEAGFRTHFLVGLGSALIMIISIYGFIPFLNMEGVSFDPSKMASQIVSGIGFIGAGTIILNKNIVKGLTTSAGIWVSAGIGIAIGVGMIELSICATAISIVCLEIVHYLNAKREFKILTVKIEKTMPLQQTIVLIKGNNKKIDLISNSIKVEGKKQIFIFEFRIYKNEIESLKYIENLLSLKLNIIEIKIDGA